MMQNYYQDQFSIDQQIKTEMKMCSYDLKCEGLELDFVSKSDDIEVRKLYKDNDIYSFFEISSEDVYLMKILLSKDKYQKRVDHVKSTLLKNFIIYALLIALLSFVFSIYALNPLKKALNLNYEFVKDMLHDINTPLASMVVNFKLFKKEIGENRKIQRMEHSIETIVSLQENLKVFLDHNDLQVEIFDLSFLSKQRVSIFKGSYSKKSFIVSIDKCNIKTNKEAMIRVLDNLISNACKYTHKDGVIEIFLKDQTLYIKDNGIGIKEPKRVFERFYKESDRGLGIGMHIVKKLSVALGIDIKIDSRVNEGTKVMLDLSEVILK
jgi:signal transduction histidine kinase